MAEKETGKGALASMTPEQQATILSAVNAQMTKLIGKSSGYLQTLPTSVQGRVKALKKLQDDKEKIDIEFEREKMELEKKFRAKYLPLYQQRTKITTGEVEPEVPKDEEEKSKVEEVKEEGKKEETPKTEEKKEDVKGVPEFWAVALSHHPTLENLITDKDKEVLKFLKDIVVKDVENEIYSFTLEFIFQENEFFEGTVLTKTYHVTEHPSFGAIFESADYSTINWKAGKDVTKEKKTIKVGGGRRGGRRGGKGGQQVTQTKTVEKPCKSFFHFFSEGGVYFGLREEEDDDQDEEEMESLAEYDYEMAATIKEQVIPNAVLWFTGEAEAAYEDGEDYDDEEIDSEGGEEDDDDDNEENDKEYKPPVNADPNQQCKQQ